MKNNTYIIEIPGNESVSESMAVVKSIDMEQVQSSEVVVFDVDGADNIGAPVIGCILNVINYCLKNNITCLVTYPQSKRAAMSVKPWYDLIKKKLSG